MAVHFITMNAAVPQLEQCKKWFTTSRSGRNLYLLLCWCSLFLLFVTTSAVGQERNPLFIPQFPVDRPTLQLTPTGRITLDRPVVAPIEPFVPLQHPVHDNSSANPEELELVIQEGKALEAEARWTEVLALYEGALRTHRNDTALMERYRIARFHSDIGRRFHDPSYLQLVRSLTPIESWHFFEEVITRIEEDYVDPPRWDTLFRHGIQNYTIALSDANFRARVGLNVTQEQLNAYLTTVQTTVNAWSFSNREDMRNGLLHIVDGAQRQIGLNSAIVIMEFTCGVVNSLDPNTAFLTPSQYSSQRSTIQGNHVGLGVLLRSDRESLLIDRVVSGSPAEERGLQAGDRIMSVDGITTRGRDTDSAADLLQGAEGTAVRLSILSPGLGQRPRDVTIIRRQIEVPSVEDVRMLTDTLGYIKLTDFKTKTRAELTRALIYLESRGMKCLVLDLRRNPGGLFNIGVDVASMFIDRGAIVRTQGRNRHLDAPSMTSGDTWHVPLIVLIDEESASASEIVAGAIRDHNRGILIGRKTFGKGTIQKIIPVMAGSTGTTQSGIRLTTEKFFSPLGWPYSGIGVTPHVPVNEDERYTVGRPLSGILPLPLPRPITSNLDDPFIREAIRVSQGMLAGK